MSDTTSHASGGRPLSYKYQRLRERLREAIVSGQLGRKLPGERVLAERFQVNAKTINKALSDLALEGLLVRHVGRGTFVRPMAEDGDAGRSVGRTFGWLGSPRHASDPQSLFVRVAEQLQGRGHRLEFLDGKEVSSGVAGEEGIPPELVRGLAGMVFWSVQPPMAVLAELHRRHLPMVWVNNHHPRLRTSAVLPDYAHGAFELTQHLLLLGHERIELRVDPELIPAAAGAEQGYAAGLKRHGLVPLEVVTHCDSLPAASATAALCVGERAAAATARALEVFRSSGRPVPALACLLEAGATCPIAGPCITCEFDGAAVCDWIVEMLVSASPGRPPRIAIVPGRTAPRQGGAEPPGSDPRPLRSPAPAVF